MRHDERFRRSRWCSGGDCVGVAVDGDMVEVANLGSDDERSLTFTREEWAAFLAGVKAGEFDLD